MGTSQNFTKDPNAVLDYRVDWSSWLSNDTITAASWTAASGITEAGSSFNTTSATIWLSGGTEGLSYNITNRILTAGSRIDDRTITITIISK